MIAHLLNESIISNVVVDVPIMSANKLRIINNRFFKIIAYFGNPDLVLMKTKLSITVGSAMPSIDKEKAPKNDINKSNFGKATASITERIEN